jgi:hypothetical protein
MPSFLRRCGLTLDDLARADEVTRSVTARWPTRHLDTPAVRMLADFRRSNEARPSVPVAPGRLEMIRVSTIGHLLSLVEMDCKLTPGAPGSPGRVDAVRASRYAILTVPMQGAAVFALLEAPPPRRPADQFVPSRGSIVVYNDGDGRAVALRGAGCDCVAGRETAWTMHAFAP